MPKINVIDITEWKFFDRTEGSEDISVIRKLMSLQVLPTEGYCPKQVTRNRVCGNQLRLRTHNGTLEWYCNALNQRTPRNRPVKCGFSKRMTSKSFFQNGKIPMASRCIILLNFLGNVNVQATAEQLKTSSTTVSLWYVYALKIVHAIITSRPVVKIGGPEHEVQLDESKFLGRRKYNRGRGLPASFGWVFGGVCSQTKFGFYQVVERRDAATLLPIIEENVEKESEVTTDHWRAYNAIGTLGYTHKKVNHSQNFVDPVTGAHTQNIESMWRAIKAFVKPRYRNMKFLQQSLSKYMFIKECKLLGEDPFIKFLNESKAFFDQQGFDDTTIEEVAFLEEIENIEENDLFQENQNDDDADTPSRPRSDVGPRRRRRIF